MRSLNENSQVFRAAGYCRLDQYDLAIQDCRTALALDPNYSKAYGRMGLALSCQNRYDQAAEAYKKAAELDPNQESYKHNLKIAEEKMKEMQNASRQAFGAGFNSSSGAVPGMPDFTQLLNNPTLVNMATQALSDPNIQNMMSQMMSGLMGSTGGENSGATSVAGLFEAGQRLAQQMQSANPELVDQLRRTFQGSADQGNNPENDADAKNDSSKQPPDQ
ncbi:hypothetical protein AB6A40_009875 [Gnathostoma spinigerum]|uniref:Small glutamine-rich tetratricopeptide repeat-containing protein alpha n=1 Tax=Gnathostoma spinigerum TaxID=75299 RepID=A0ABD6ETJ1_9BILA